MASYDFADMLKYSNGVQQATDMETIRALLPGCLSVEKTDTDTDKTGIDYVATLRRNAEVLIDAKTRQPGASKWWKNGAPDIALEIWSVIPENGLTGKTGWTLSEAAQVDYILYTFDPCDCKQVFLYPFQLLRLTFRANINEWSKQYKTGFQSSDGWRSQCLFVPEHVVWRAMRQIVAPLEKKGT